MKKDKTFYPLGKELVTGGLLANNLLQPVLLFSLCSHTFRTCSITVL